MKQRFSAAGADRQKAGTPPLNVQPNHSGGLFIRNNPCAAIFSPDVFLRSSRSRKLSPLPQEFFNGQTFYATMLFFCKRVADSCNEVIPFPLLRAGIVQRHAMYIRAGEVASVVPDIRFTKTRHDKKIGSDSPVNSRGLRQAKVLVEKRTRRISLGVAKGLYR
jgi:hypothetical protein